MAFALSPRLGHPRPRRSSQRPAEYRRRHYRRFSDASIGEEPLNDLADGSNIEPAAFVPDENHLALADAAFLRNLQESVQEEQRGVAPATLPKCDNNIISPELRVIWIIDRYLIATLIFLRKLLGDVSNETLWIFFCVEVMLEKRLVVLDNQIFHLACQWEDGGLECPRQTADHGNYNEQSFERISRFLF